MMSPNASRRTAHIESLAKAHGIAIKNTRLVHAVAYINSRTIEVPYPCRTAKDYLAALHEIGHLVAGSKENAMLIHLAPHHHDDLHFSEEAIAWHWALTHAEPELITRRAEHFARWCLWSHAPGVERRQIGYDLRFVHRTVAVLTILLGFSLAIVLGM